MITAIAAGAAVVFVLAKNPLFDRAFSIPQSPAAALETLRLGPKPNQYLVLPKGWGAETPHRESPEFAMPPEELERRFFEIALSEPRTARLSRDTIAARSWFWRFPDLITVRFVARDGGKSALAVYARALYGHSDLGKNKKRIDRWISELGPDS